ncbi:class I SAM-dependent methyltransferase [Pseudonocardia kunmingensis]|uniref:Methyltransferase family protein n=1 Tax=Pseudonocardia kunmingensis TaxID=630975 RepID=A0A543E2F0_9PSEU|nr:class I SAM-dependent methyltransferase [Pseudonocardia kunmingensis]TQM15766.1 methyltransferase family protein [Pseudonocardia kunmingensis]
MTAAGRAGPVVAARRRWPGPELPADEQVSTAFDAALTGGPVRMLRSDGAEIALAVQRWRGDAAGDDGWLLDRCTGPALDLGCGPGRLVAALARRGIPALGVDASAAAVTQCRARGAAVVRRDVFGALPAAGRWQHVLLADGNIGIGGDPARLLRRAAALLAPGGTVLVETDPDPRARWSGTARVHTPDGAGPPLPWAVVGAVVLRELAAAVGLGVSTTATGPRSFAELRAVPRSRLRSGIRTTNGTFVG